jgi:hypothetical protein
MVMSTAGVGTGKVFAGEAQQQLQRPFIYSQRAPNINKPAVL